MEDRANVFHASPPGQASISPVELCPDVVLPGIRNQPMVEMGVRTPDTGSRYLGDRILGVLDDRVGLLRSVNPARPR